MKDVLLVVLPLVSGQLTNIIRVPNDLVWQVRCVVCIQRLLKFTFYAVAEALDAFADYIHFGLLLFLLLFSEELLRGCFLSQN